MGSPYGKPAPPSFSINLSDFVQSIEWIKAFLHKKFGVRVGKVVHDAYPNLWRCYDVDGEIITNIDHALMSRLAIVLAEIDALWLQDLVEKEEEELLRNQYADEEDGA